MEKKNDVNVNELLMKIKELIQKSENRPYTEKIKDIISYRLKSESKIRSILLENKKDILYKSLGLDRELLFNDKEHSILTKYGEDEDEQDYKRARYTYGVNNAVLRMLKYVLDLNDNTDTEQKVRFDEEALKLCCSQFIINFYFETIVDRLTELNNEDVNTMSDKLQDFYKKIEGVYDDCGLADLELIRDIADRNNIRQEFIQNIEDKINELVNAGKEAVIPVPQFKFLRNCASHGEFYPDLEKKVVTVSNKGRYTQNFKFDEIIGEAQSFHKLFSSHKVELFERIIESDNIVETLKGIKKDISEGTITTDQVMSNFGILLLFNTIQYNNERSFKDIYLDSDTKSNIDALDINKYFKRTTNVASSMNNPWDLMEIIKYGISHMRITNELNDQNEPEICFTNPQGQHETITIDLDKIYKFVLESGVHELSTTTHGYYKTIAKIKEKVSDGIPENELNDGTSDFLESEIVRTNYKKIV